MCKGYFPISVLISKLEIPSVFVCAFVRLCSSCSDLTYFFFVLRFVSAVCSSAQRVFFFKSVRGLRFLLCLFPCIAHKASCGIHFEAFHRDWYRSCNFFKNFKIPPAEISFRVPIVLPSLREIRFFFCSCWPDHLHELLSRSRASAFDPPLFTDGIVFDGYFSDFVIKSIFRNAAANSMRSRRLVRISDVRFFFLYAKV